MKSKVKKKLHKGASDGRFVDNFLELHEMQNKPLFLEVFFHVWCSLEVTFDLSEHGTLCYG